jgi:cobaltochelatase CobN
MHLTAQDVGRIEDGDVAVDLGQPPGEIVILSAADTELALLAAVADGRNAGAPSIRMANLGKLSHPLSVDLYLEKTVTAAKLVVVRAMGGIGYWPYGLEQLRAMARARGDMALIVVPGEDRWDAALEAYSTLPAEQCRLLWRYLVEGGNENARRALGFLDHLVGHAALPPSPVALPHAGHYWPGAGEIGVEDIAQRLAPSWPIAPIVFYRSVIQGGATAPIDALAATLAEHEIAALPIFVTSLKDRESEEFLAEAFARFPPAAVLNTTSFSVSRIGAGHAGTVLDRPGRPVLQVVLAGSSEEGWRESARGLGPRDLTMNVVLPEVDGRILTRAVSFKEERGPAATYRAVPDRIAFVARQAAKWVTLGAKAAAERKIALVLSNYPDRDGRIANGVGLDTPESTARIARAIADAGYALRGFPETGAELMAVLLGGVTNAHASPPPPSSSPGLTGGPTRTGHAFARSGGGERSSAFAEDDGNGVTIAAHDYAAFLATCPEPARAAMAARWGEPESDPFFADDAFHLAIHRFGNVVVGIQPQRGYAIDPKATYHDPDLVPPHHYLAFYAWLRNEFRADAIVHVGKHGNLEWLPGKALGLSETCWPEVALGDLPLIYPFIVNDPGEGSQAKRRASAAIVDHLMPAMTRAETDGPLAELETLIDEYYVAAGVDKRRRDHLAGEIVALAERHGLDRDLGFTAKEGGDALRALDAHLCELKEMQIRDGLHTLGLSPAGRQRIDTLVAIARTPRSGGRPADASLHRAIADDLGLGFDPLDCDMAAEWAGPRPEILAAVSDAPWRSAGDTVERIEMLAGELVAAVTPLPEGERASRLISDSELGAKGEGAQASSTMSGTPAPQPSPLRGEGATLPHTTTVLSWIATDLAPALDASGDAEIAAVLTALDGRFLSPGPSGAPTRGRPDVLPTGRNFYSVDVRAVPTAAAWTLGRRAADAMALRYFQDEGEWPRSIAMSAWGTSNMRTGGDDIAQVMALIGAEPVSETGTGRVTGFKVMALAELGRPRIDVTLKVSGMFRDAFPGQIDLIDSAIRAIAALDEADESNPIAASARATRARLTAAGVGREAAGVQAASRIFGAKPGAYGAGLQVPIDTGTWDTRRDLAEAFLAWGGFVYGGGQQGEGARAALTERLASVDAVLHNQDNREHDILDSDDYYQFQGGLAATVETLKGAAPRVYHGDHSRPEKPVVRALGEEIARVVRGRAANPKWIAGVMRHGYKGAFEIAATVDYLFAYAATTNAVQDHHFDQLFDAYIGNDEVRAFIADNNAPALSEIATRFREAIDRGLWAPRLNSVYDRLSAMMAEPKEAAE